MSDIERNEIIYEEGWRDSSPAPVEEPPVDEAPVVEERSAAQAFPLLISIQLALCVLAAVALFILKAMDSGLYHDIMTYYRTEMNKPVISQEYFKAVRLEGMSDRASADELSPR